MTHQHYQERTPKNMKYHKNIKIHWRGALSVTMKRYQYNERHVHNYITVL